MPYALLLGQHTQKGALPLRPRRIRPRLIPRTAKCRVGAALLVGKRGGDRGGRACALDTFAIPQRRDEARAPVDRARQAPAKNFKGNMIMTQDTVIDYRMVQKSAEAHLKKPEKEKPLVYNMMTYRSAVVFWRYPEKTEDINTVFRASETNSGVCFGVSVQALKLRECVLAASALSSEQEILLDSLSAQLRMTTDQLKTCLSESWVFDREFKPDFPTEIILLESSFTTEPSLTADIVAPQKNQSPYQIKNGFLDEMVARTRTLQAVRIRYRIADLAENKQTLFKLGDSDSSPGIQLNSVTRAGSEGVVDIDTQWMTPYLKDQLSESPDPSKASRQAIPPVALLHQ